MTPTWTIPECLQRLGEVATTTGALWPQEAAYIAEAIETLTTRLGYEDGKEWYIDSGCREVIMREGYMTSREASIARYEMERTGRYDKCNLRIYSRDAAILEESR